MATTVQPGSQPEEPNNPDIREAGKVWRDRRRRLGGKFLDGVAQGMGETVGKLAAAAIVLLVLALIAWMATL
ncbi:hypothetical protein [Streptomyces sp. NPDC059957]|uniref:hypothetical protein n=1 Tax=Streptomyces sp. NPDC059957 TaxID=3347016 RepID=UPI0036506E55